MTVSTPTQVGFERILVPTDFSDVSQRALQWAKSIARLNGAALLLAHASEVASAISPPEVVWFDQFAGQRSDEEQLTSRAAELESDGFQAKTALLVGTLQREILGLADREQTDLIVMGTLGRGGLSRLFLGSETESLFRQASCPILAVGPEAREAGLGSWHPKEILCACDLDPDSAPTAAYAHRLGREYGANVTIVHVEDSEAHASRELQIMRFEFALSPLLPEGAEPRYLNRVLMLGYNLGATIADIAVEWKADLIVIGAHGATAAQSHLPRGIAPQVIAKAPCPVMVLHK